MVEGLIGFQPLIKVTHQAMNSEIIFRNLLGLNELSSQCVEDLLADSLLERKEVVTTVVQIKALSKCRPTQTCDS